VRLGEVFSHRQTFNTQTWREIIERHHGPQVQQPRAYAAVIRTGSRRFVLVFDEVLENEDIVVKPLNPLLRPLIVYAASAILGDGGVVMILSTEGIARHSGVFQKASETELPALAGESQPAEPFLLAKCGSDELLAIPLNAVRSVVRASRDNLQRAGNRTFININGEVLNLVRLQEFLNLAPAPDSTSFFLVIPKNARAPLGFVVSEIVDTVLLNDPINRQAFTMDGVAGTALVGGRIAIVPDLNRLAAIWEQSQGASRPALPEASHQKILIVEDTKFFQTLVGNCLREAGFTVVVTANGSEGLAALEQQSFDLVVSDIEMPVMDGHAFARRVRANPQWSGLPLLALTTLGSAESRKATHESGFDAHETKFDRVSFLAAVNALLTQTAAASASRGAAPHE
jgi:two-component system chemotaxis sensor kinase CheA